MRPQLRQIPIIFTSVKPRAHEHSTSHNSLKQFTDGPVLCETLSFGKAAQLNDDTHMKAMSDGITEGAGWSVIVACAVAAGGGTREGRVPYEG